MTSPSNPSPKRSVKTCSSLAPSLFPILRVIPLFLGSFCASNLSYMIWAFNFGNPRSIRMVLGHLLCYIRGEHENTIKVYSSSNLPSILGKYYLFQAILGPQLFPIGIGHLIWEILALQAWFMVTYYIRMRGARNLRRIPQSHTIILHTLPLILSFTVHSTIFHQFFMEFEVQPSLVFFARHGQEQSWEFGPARPERARPTQAGSPFYSPICEVRPSCHRAGPDPLSSFLFF